MSQVMNIDFSNSSRSFFPLNFVTILALATVSAGAAIYSYVCHKKTKIMDTRMKELEKSLNTSLKNCDSERQGRIRAQKALRDSLTKPHLESPGKNLFPMIPVGVVNSCFSTRNGTPRQPLLVPMARARLVFDVSRVPPASLDGFKDYSHCWIIYVFHLNTDLDKLWKEPSRAKIKAKVRVPKLKGERMGLFATRSPHRPCPIGLTVAKVEEVNENCVLLSGVDLVDGTPVLDIKPYLPYCDAIQGAKVPKWVLDDDMLAVSSVSFAENFSSSLLDCWNPSRNSLYSSADEIQMLVKQVLSWDIRSISQRNKAHSNDVSNCDTHLGSARCSREKDVLYYLVVEGIKVSYFIRDNGDVIVEKAVHS